MKKLMGISMIAAMAVLPMSANAARSSAIANPANFTAGGSNAALATTSYVQGAYKASSDRIDALITDTAVTGEHNVITAGDSVAENMTALDNKIGGATFTGASITAAIAALQNDAGNLGSAKVTNEGNFTEASNSDLIKNKTVIGAIQSVADQVDTNTGAIADEVTNRTNAVAAEASAREQAVAAEASARAEAVSAEASAREQAVSAEASARASADTTLTNAINAVAASLNSSNTAADEKYATKVGTLATINASTVPVVTTWGQDVASATTLTITAPDTYKPGTVAGNTDSGDNTTQDVGAGEDEVEGDGPDLDELLGL